MIYVVDFAINAVQACCRALIVDTLPVSRQQIGSAWASRMIAVGNIAGYFAYVETDNSIGARELTAVMVEAEWWTYEHFLETPSGIPSLNN